MELRTKYAIIPDVEEVVRKGYFADPDQHVYLQVKHPIDKDRYVFFIEKNINGVNFCDIVILGKEFNKIMSD